MNNFYKSLLFAFIICSLASCATGKNAFDKGDYETALSRAIKRLQSNPNNKKAEEVLINGYALASQYHLTLIKDYSKSGDVLKWERIYAEYAWLNKYYREIMRCPACLNSVKPTSYLDEQRMAGQEAAEVQLSLGIDLMTINTIETGRQAYNHFESAYRYDNGIQSIDSLLSAALEMGTVKVLIESIPVHSRTLQLTNEYFENRMFEYFRQFENNRFVKFINFEEMEGYQIAPDHIISMQFDDFSLGQTLIESKSREIKKDSVVVGTYTDDEGSKHDVFGTVKADYTNHVKTLASNGLLNFEIKDAYTGQVLINRKIEGEDIWRYEWASFNGDERALTKKQLRLAKKQELPPPQAQELFGSFIDRIYDQVINQVRQLYRDTRI